jgi:uncharacterized protein DUF5996
VRTARGSVRRIQLEPRSVADFYRELMGALDEARVPVAITELPSEVPSPIPFSEDVEHASYEPEFANKFWHALVSVDAVLKEHRARFRGRTSPVQFFWGSFDLSYSRFSGRPAEPPPDADVITRHAADAEQISAGFWPGDARLTEPAFFGYTSPSPAGFEQAQVEPQAARWSVEIGEFLLPYEAVRTAADPRGTLLDFLESTYRAGAGAAGWE